MRKQTHFVGKNSERETVGRPPHIDRRQESRGLERSRVFSRRTATGLLAAAALLPWVGRAAADSGQVPATVSPYMGYPLFDEAAAVVNPSAGYRSRIVLWDSLQKLVRYGVLDREKVPASETGPNQAPDVWSQKLSGPTFSPIVLTRANAAYYVDLLWPIGLANRLAANALGSLAGPSLQSFASTGGWTLGRSQNGGVYFDKYAIVDMSPAAEALAVRVAKATFRPCCDNSTFFQDCNHGSALFAVLQLGAAQGLDEAALYREALAFNSFWFPDNYTATALLFKVVHETDWHQVDPRLVMGAEFSSASGWQNNVMTPLQVVRDLIPPPPGSVNCGA